MRLQVCQYDLDSAAVTTIAAADLGFEEENQCQWQMVDPVSIAAAVVVHNFNHEGTTDAIVANEAEEPTN